jgi:hypothetical protein
MDAWRGEITAVFQAGKAPRRIFATAASEGREHRDAAFSTDAFDWQTVP